MHEIIIELMVYEFIFGLAIGVVLLIALVGYIVIKVIKKMQRRTSKDG